MSYKRAIVFGIYLWIAVFAIFSFFLFLPLTKDSALAQSIGLWAFLIPTVLLLSKWYFRKNEPSALHGLGLGVVALVVGIVLDLLITIPFFLAQESSYNAGLKELFGNWFLYIGFAEVLLLTTFAGWEFDATFTTPDPESDK